MIWKQLHSFEFCNKIIWICDCNTVFYTFFFTFYGGINVVTWHDKGMGYRYTVLLIVFISLANVLVLYVC